MSTDPDEAFIIMQIGDGPMDAVCDEAIVPAIRAAGLEPKRVDRDNEGDLLKSEIIRFIERSSIIVADLTNERPNCYLEVGYAMGLGKKQNLILTVRADHHHSHKDWTREGKRVHFDLEGYDLLLWDPDNLDQFQADLTARIKRRSIVVRDGAGTTATRADEPLDFDSWRGPLRAHASKAIDDLKLVTNIAGYMEVAAQIGPPVNVSQAGLLEAQRAATVSTFGWPIGLVGPGDDRPRPTSDGIQAEIQVLERPNAADAASYDYWKLFTDGRFYTLLNLFEDERRAAFPDHPVLAFDTRAVRVTEAFLLLVRLYRRLGASDGDEITVEVRHAGLAGRKAVAMNPGRTMFRDRESMEDVATHRVTASLAELEGNLSAYVMDVLRPLFVLFDLLVVSDDVLSPIIENFIEGRAT